MTRVMRGKEEEALTAVKPVAKVIVVRLRTAMLPGCEREDDAVRLIGELAAKWPVPSCSDFFVQGMAAQGPVANPMLMVKLEGDVPLVAAEPVTNGFALRS